MRRRRRLRQIQKIDGISMLPALSGTPNKQKQHESLYWEFRNSRSLRMGNWKLIDFDKTKEDKVVELYNLAEDLGEQMNVAEQHPEIVAKMLGFMN